MQRIDSSSPSAFLCVCTLTSQSPQQAVYIAEITSTWLDLLSYCHPSSWSVSQRAGHPELPIMFTVRQQEETPAQPPSSPFGGYTSLFVFLQAVQLHCKHHCCIIHSRREAAVPEDWQVMGQQDAAEPHRRLEGKSCMTRMFQLSRRNPVWKHDRKSLIKEPPFPESLYINRNKHNRALGAD